MSGDGPSVCGHLLVYAGKRGGYYFHVAGGVHTYPRYMDDQGYRRYLRDNGKRELARLPVNLPNPQGALLYLEELLSKEWTWLVLPNNCVAFVEEVVAAGGGTWASLSNCPSVATTESLRTRIQRFLGRLEAEICGLYGVPR